MGLKLTQKRQEQIMEPLRRKVREALEPRSLGSRIYPHLKTAAEEEPRRGLVGGWAHLNKREKWKMSRFQLTQACSAGAFHFRAGDKIADSTANAIAGDKINAALCAAPFAGMVPLDSAAVSALAAVGITATIGVPLIPVTGAASIDA
jgi:hypothetical protein